MKLADEYAHASACEVEGFDPKTDAKHTQAARVAFEAHAALCLAQ